MFSILDEIIKIQTNELMILPLKIERVRIKEFSQLDVRYKLSKYTFEVSKFTQGILAMERTLMGVIEVDPKKLLEDGVRKVLVQRIVDILDNGLIFKSGKLIDFVKTLSDVSEKLQGMHRSFECMYLF
jgi:WASH complex subunit strumpellin